MAENWEDVWNLWRRARLGTGDENQVKFVESEMIADGRVKVCCEKNQNGQREDEDEAWGDRDG